MAPDPDFAFVEGPCCPTLDFAIVFWIMFKFYTLLTSQFCISVVRLDIQQRKKTGMA